LNEKPEKRETAESAKAEEKSFGGLATVLLTFSFHISCKVQQLLVLAL